MAIEFRITVEHVSELQGELELLLKGLVTPLAAVKPPADYVEADDPSFVRQTPPEPKVEAPTAPTEPTKPEQPVAAKKGGKKANGNGEEEKFSPDMLKARGLMTQYSALYGIDPAVNDLQEALRRRFITKKYTKLAMVPEADLKTVVGDLEKMVKDNPFKRKALKVLA
jgi:hypothetical protein